VYSPTSLFFFLLSENKHCDNEASNSNSENARNRMVARLRGSEGTGTKEDKSSTGRVWAAGFVLISHCIRKHLVLLTIPCFDITPIA